MIRWKIKMVTQYQVFLFLLCTPGLCILNSSVFGLMPKIIIQYYFDFQVVSNQDFLPGQFSKGHEVTQTTHTMNRKELYFKWSILTACRSFDVYIIV